MISGVKTRNANSKDMSRCITSKPRFRNIFNNTGVAGYGELS